MYNTKSDIRFKTTILKPSLCDYSDAYLFAKGRITITGEGNNAADRQSDEKNKSVVFKNCTWFINCTSEINNIEIDKAEDIDILTVAFFQSG